MIDKVLLEDRSLRSVSLDFALSNQWKNRHLKEELEHYLYEYEGLARRLEEFVKMLNSTTNKANPKFQENILID